MSLISVLMPIYNAERYCSAAIMSILNQSHKNLELIIINDGSTDNSMDVIEQIALTDKRIKIFSQENLGVISALNLALNKASGDYIARMDADDISYPSRLTKQIEFLKNNPDVAVLGSSYDYIDEFNNKVGKRSTLTKHQDIKASFFFGNPIAHPSVMINCEVLMNTLQYDENYKTAEDFQLWLKISNKYKLANLKETLLSYRVLSTSVSTQALVEQKNVAIKALLNSTFLQKIPLGNFIAYSIYGYTPSLSSAVKYISACIALNFFNLRYQWVSRRALFKRTIFAIPALWRKKIRG